jgi:hypothetical protein
MNKKLLSLAISVSMVAGLYGQTINQSYFIYQKEGKVVVRGQWKVILFIRMLKGIITCVLSMIIVTPI